MSVIVFTVLTVRAWDALEGMSIAEFAVAAVRFSFPGWLLALVVVFVGRRLSGRRGLGRWRDVLVLAAAFGLLSAAPVTAAWHDGCNAHRALVPLFADQLIERSQPERPDAIYIGSVTEVLCG